MANNKIGIDIGGTNLKVAWVEDNHISSEIIERGTPDNIDQFRTVLWEILNSININNETRLGFSVPGVVDYTNGNIDLCPNLEYLNGINVKDLLQREECMVGNDADMALLGEISSNDLWEENIGLVALGTGIGSSYYISHTGPWQSNLLSEIGHIKVASNGRRCTCGGLDCLETYFSGWSLISQAKKSGLEVEDVYELFNLAQNSNQVASSLILQNIPYLGIAISSMINLTGINKVILTGKISRSYDLFQEALYNSVSNALHPHAKKDFQVIKSSLIDHSSIIGAVARFK
ncbi:MAG: N-acetylglucosamine repressor [bacterium ADurb.Bin212]|nr:MAG: N-acetylglucosamine repressor [bacterium ADurb.Bin212]